MPPLHTAGQPSEPTQSLNAVFEENPPPSRRLLAPTAPRFTPSTRLDRLWCERSVRTHGEDLEQSRICARKLSVHVISSSQELEGEGGRVETEMIHR